MLAFILFLNYFILNKYVDNQYKLGFNDGKLYTKNSIVNKLSKYFESTDKDEGLILFSFKTTDVTVIKKDNKYFLKIVK